MSGVARRPTVVGGGQPIPATPSLDLGKLKKELRKGNRSTLCAVKNGTDQTIVKKTPGEPVINGKWIQVPPETIPPNTVAYFGAIGKGILAGTDGKVSFAIPGLEGEYIFSWNNGKDKDKRGWEYSCTDELRDAAFQVFEEGNGDKHQEIAWTIGNAPSLLLNAEPEEKEQALPMPMGGGSSIAHGGGQGSGHEGHDGEETEEDLWGAPAVEKKINVIIRDTPAPTASDDDLRKFAGAFGAAPANPALVRTRATTGSRVMSGMGGADDWMAGATASPADPVKSAKAHFRQTMLSLDIGNLAAAHTSMSECLKTLVSLPESTPNRQKMLRQAARYQVSLSLLDEVKKAEAAGSKPAELLPLLTLLAVQPLRHDHRIINMRRLINENIKAKNPHIALRFLNILCPLGLRDKDALAAKKKECEEMVKKVPKDGDAALPEKDKDGKLVRVCYKSLKPITTPKALVCKVTGATYALDALKGQATDPILNEPTSKLVEE